MAVARPSVPKDLTSLRATVESDWFIVYRMPSYRMFFLEIKEIRLPGVFGLVGGGVALEKREGGREVEGGGGGGGDVWEGKRV